MTSRCPGAACLGIGRLPDYRLAFDAWSNHRAGFVADVLPAFGRDVWGVLWSVTEEHVESLDRFEGVSRRQYRREKILVESARGEAIDAFAYVICDPVEEGPTTHDYKALLLEGATEHGLPSVWVDALEAISSLPAPLSPSSSNTIVP